MSRLAEPGARGVGSPRQPSSASKAGGSVESAAPLIIQFAKLTKSLEADSKAFGTVKDTKEFRERVAATIASGREMFADVSSVLLRNRGMSKGGRVDAQTDRLQSDLNNVMDSFEAAVKRCETLSRVARSAAVAVSSSGGAVDSDEEDDAKRIEETRQRFREEIVGVKGFGHVEMSILMEKNEEAVEIVREAAELHSMFRDFNVLVSDQSEGIKVADKHVEDTKIKIQEGNTHIVEAAEYQSKIRKKWCMFLIFVLVIAGAVVVPIVITKKLL